MGCLPGEVWSRLAEEIAELRVLVRFRTYTEENALFQVMVNRKALNGTVMHSLFGAYFRILMNLRVASCRDEQNLLRVDVSIHPTSR